MQKTKHWLTTIAALLCSVMVDAATYSDWTSTNKGQSSSTSSNTYTITASAGEVLSFDWLVSSESNYDKLIITIGGTEILNKSGELSGRYQYTFTSSGTYTMVVKYTKDGSVDRGSDYAKVCNITLDTEDAGDSGDSGTENIVDSGTCGTNLTWKLTDEGKLIIEGIGDMSNYNWNTSSPWYSYVYHITTVIVGEGVTSIGNYAFEDCSRLAAITIPESVTSIGNYAFYYCSRLAAITIPESVTSIGNEAFYDTAWYNNQPDGVVYIGNILYCYKGDMTTNTSIKIKDGTKSIAGNAFYNCTNLTSITIPESVTSVGNNAFNYCSSLKTVTLPENSQLTSIGYQVFDNCSSLTTITIPRSVTSIGTCAFFYCTSLKTVTIPENSQLTSIGYYAFKGCSFLTSINIPESVTSIGDEAFALCTSLKTVTIPENSQLTSIGEKVFNRCENLTAITIPEGVTSIEKQTFYECIRLTAVHIGEGVTSIGEEAFFNCSSLTAVHISDIAAWCNIHFYGDDSNPLRYDDKLYLNGELVTELIIPEGVTSIENYAFNGCSSLTSITIPASVKSMGNYAFCACSALTSVAFSKNSRLTSIGAYAFNGCTSLTTITIPKDVTSIGSYAFRGCSRLTSIKCKAAIPPTVGSSTFENVDKSIPVYVPAGSVAAYQSAAYWNEFTCIQPSEETITINQYCSGTYCSEYALDFSKVEGLKAYAATGYNSETGVITLTRVMTAKAGVGLFFVGEAGTYTVPTMENTSDNSLNMLVGTLSETTLNSTSSDGKYRNYRYTTKTGEPAPLFYEIEDGYTFKANRAYLQIPTAWLPAEARAISLRFDEGKGTTDMDEWTIDNGQLIIYDLTGRKVSEPQKGNLYIVNGKKIIY